MDKTKCPECKSDYVSYYHRNDKIVYICNRCDRVWTENAKAMPDET
jgi:uncharacterized Zn ribbon protein